MVKEDFLTRDKEIPGQKFVCLSFVSPENVLKNKDSFIIKEFLNELNSELKLNYDDIQEKYENFKYRNEIDLSKKFDEENNFQTSLRGLKVKGVFSTHKEAAQKAHEFHKDEPSFHVFVGEVGVWMPWDPTYKYLDTIEGQEYQEETLNELIHSYQKNEAQKELFFKERKNEALKQNLLNNMENKSDPWLEKIEGAEGENEDPAEAPMESGPPEDLEN